MVIDKPAGLTSHDVVQRVRRRLSERRVGHAGTLDPDATGVLVIGVGRATRLLRFTSELAKSYVGEVVFGTATSTLDAAGEVTATYEMGSITLDDVARAALALTGPIEQTPPMVSALKVGGRRLYALAREGIEIERAPRPVEVYRFEVSATHDPRVYAIEVDCSSGTYVRVLAADLGLSLGGGAHLRALRRTAIGSFGLDRAVGVDDLVADDVRPAKELVAHLATAEVEGDLATSVGHGRALDRRALGASGDGPWSIVDRSGQLLAVYAASALERLKPVVVADSSGGAAVRRR